MRSLYGEWKENGLTDRHDKDNKCNKTIINKKCNYDLLFINKYNRDLLYVYLDR